MTAMPKPLPALVVSAAIALVAASGCRLVDQRRFEQTGLYPGAAQLARADYAQRALPPPPLATIRFGTQSDDWQAGLIAAARDARERKADVAFDVVAPIPTSASLAAQDAAEKAGAQDAATVATVLEGDGVSADQIHLGARGDPGQPPREIEVYVR
jgi:hypothetical protein